jgi:hypothetical protein
MVPAATNEDHSPALQLTGALFELCLYLLFYMKFSKLCRQLTQLSRLGRFDERSTTMNKWSNDTGET